MNAYALPYLAVARVRGADAADFLQAQLSAEIAGLPGGGASFACYCSPRGQVYGLLLVCREPEMSAGENSGAWRLVTAAELLPSILERLRRFVLRARVELEPAADLAVCAAPEPEASATGVFHTLPGLGYRIVDSVACAADERTTGAWKAGELRHGVAWLGLPTSERFIPQMLGFDQIGAVSFSKGCYPGQEIVARARYLGTVKRKPLRLLVDGLAAPAPGVAVRLLSDESGAANWIDGTVIDSAPSGTGQAVVLVVAPAPDGGVTALDCEGSRYFCATM